MREPRTDADASTAGTHRHANAIREREHGARMPAPRTPGSVGGCATLDTPQLVIDDEVHRIRVVDRRRRVQVLHDGLDLVRRARWEHHEPVSKANARDPLHATL